MKLVAELSNGLSVNGGKSVQACWRGMTPCMESRGEFGPAATDHCTQTTYVYGSSSFVGLHVLYSTIATVVSICTDSVDQHDVSCLYTEYTVSGPVVV